MELTAQEKMFALASEFDRRQAEITKLQSVNADLLEALMQLLDALPFGARGEPDSRMDKAITKCAEAIIKARGDKTQE